MGHCCDKENMKDDGKTNRDFHVNRGKKGKHNRREKEEHFEVKVDRE